MQLHVLNFAPDFLSVIGYSSIETVRKSLSSWQMFPGNISTGSISENFICFTLLWQAFLGLVCSARVVSSHISLASKGQRVAGCQASPAHQAVSACVGHPSRSASLSWHLAGAGGCEQQRGLAASVRSWALRSGRVFYCHGASEVWERKGPGSLKSFSGYNNSVPGVWLVVVFFCVCFFLMHVLLK